MTNFFSLSGRLRRPAHPLARPLVALALLLAPAGAAQAQSFAAAVAYTTGGTFNYHVATGDLNGDGQLDIVTTNLNGTESNGPAGSVGVLLGQAGGTFAAGVAYPSGGTTTYGVALADVNSDGRLDVVTANEYSNNVSVLLGTGTGTLGSATTYSTGTNSAPFGVAVGDVNGDGKLDIVAANTYFTTSGNSTVGVLLGTGTGTFGPVTAYPLRPTNGNGGRGITLADLNKDARLDIVVVDVNKGIEVLLGQAAGGFSAATAYAVQAAYPFFAAVADINQDGNADIVTAGGGAVSLLPGTGTGTFGAVVNNTSVSSNIAGFALGDVTGDGLPDALVANRDASTIGVLVGTATGTFGNMVSYPTGGTSSQSFSLALGDFNKDGKADIAVANTNNSRIGVLLNTAVFAAPTLTSISPTSGPVGLSVTLTGTNLSGATAVSFNGTAATTFAVVNATTVTATVPTGATTGNVTVTTSNGTSNGVAFAVTPPTNNALAFDGSNDYVSVPNNAAYNITGAITLEAWVNTSNSGEQYITTKSDDSWYLALNGAGVAGGRASFYLNVVSANSGGWLYGTSNLADGRWHHVAGTYDGSTLRLYVDGVLENSRAATGTIPTGGSPVSIGARGTGLVWNGRMDEFRIYNTGLTAAQVQADMFSTTTAAALTGNLKAYYNFDQGIAGGTNTGLTALPDLSSTANPGTLTNFALTGNASNWVRSFPTITGISPTSGAAGSSVTVTGTNLLDATGFKFNTGAVAPFTAPTDDLSATVTVPTTASTGPVSLSSATLTRYNGPVFTFLAGDLVVSTTMTILPATYNNITVTGPNGNGTLGGDVVVNGALVVQSGGTLADGCNLITGPGTFTLAAGGTLSICRPRGILAVGDPQGNIGLVRVTGGRSFASDASYIYAGSDATGSGLPNQVRNLSITVPGDVALSAPTSVTQALTLSSTGNLVLGSNALTLLSSASGTALVVNSGIGVVQGTATVQRYIDPSLNAGPGYRQYSSPVANTTVADLATAGFAPVVNPTYNTSATPLAETPFPTVYGYDQSRLASTSNNLSAFDKGWFSPAATAEALVVGRGYTVNIGASELVDFNGTLNNGPVTQTLSRNSGATAPNAGWHLLGNPYPAPLDYSLVAPADRANLDRAIYVFGSTGQYVGNYRSYVNGIGGNPVLPVAQGFFVRVSSGQTSGTLTFRNSQRLTAPDATAFQRTAADARPLVQLELRGATGPADALYAYAQTGATPAFDSEFDAAKLANSTGLNLSSAAASGETLSIDGRPVFTVATVLPLAVGVPAAGTYTLSAAALNNLPTGLDAYLRDAQTGQTVNLRTQPAYTFTVTAAQATALLTGRFTLQFSASALATTAGITAAEVSLYPNPAHNAFAVQLPGVAGAATVQAELLNALGQVVRRQAAALPAGGATLQVETVGLAAGVYTLRLQAGNTSLAKRVVLN